MNFLDEMKTKAKSNKKNIVLPESFEERTLKAVDIILKEDIANIILIGNKDEILEKAKGLDISKATFIDPSNYSEMDRLIDCLVDLRKAKGMVREEAEKLLKENPLYLGVMLVKEDIADGMVAGAINSTANVLRPSLQILKPAPDTKIVSSFFIMVVPNCDYGHNGTLVFSDSALVQSPTSEELAAIAQSSAQSFERLFNVEPLVAMLSHSTKGTAKHADIDKVIEATRMAKLENPNLKIDGEFQLDAAIVPEVANLKAPNSEVGGRANVLIFPDLDAANIGYKLVQRFAKAEAYGPITQGISKPINDLSRGCSAEDIIGVVAITAVQAQNKL